mmetsp:Transcript_97829/g.273900  ORF Transcript_97829/g.273900 Transcript_97829/m.273900 type:complete len:209 (+) Transcript_97829:77-703(+)
MHSYSCVFYMALVVGSVGAGRPLLEQKAFLPPVAAKRSTSARTTVSAFEFQAEDAGQDIVGLSCDNNVRDNTWQRNGSAFRKQAPPPRGSVIASLLSILLTISIVVSLPFLASANEGNISQGAILFNNNCASCHRGGENMIQPAKTLQEKDLVKNLGSADQATLQKFFTDSFVHKLLNFPSVPGGKLSESNILDVTSYISDQALGNKW